jgi:hypothetical protein
MPSLARLNPSLVKYFIDNISIQNIQHDICVGALFLYEGFY